MTLGKNLSIVESVGSTTAYLQANSSDASLINQGSINASGSNSTFDIYSFASFTNQGSITASASGSASFDISATSFTNKGTITVSNGEILSITGSFTNATGASLTITGNNSIAFLNGNWNTAGTISVINGGTIGLGGTFTLTALNTITISGGTIGINGTLDNTGTTFAVGTGTSFGTVGLGGTIQNGIVTDAGAGFDFGGGTLAGVTYQGVLDLSAAGSQLTITNGLTVTGAGGVGPGTINLTGGFLSQFGSGRLTFQGSQTIDNATINIGHYGDGDTIYSQDNGSAATLTLGKNLSIVESMGSTTGELTGYDGSQSLINQGSIIASGSNSAFDIYSFANFTNQGSITASASGSASFNIEVANFANSGTITVSNGDALHIQSTTFSNTGTISIGANSRGYFSGGFSNSGTIAVASGSAIYFQSNLTTAQLGTVSAAAGTVVIEGTLDNTGATLSIGAGTVLGAIALVGTIKGGVIADAGEGLAAGFSDSTLSGVIYQGLLDLSQNGQYLTITNGLTVTGTGGSGPGTINLTSGASSNSLTFQGSQVIDNATIDIGSNKVGYHDTIQINSSDNSGVALTLGVNLNIVGVNKYASLTGYYGNETIVNKGTITAVANNGGFYITPNAFTNNGAIAVSGGDTLYIQPSGANGAFTNLSGATLTGGSYEADAGSVIELANNVQISTDNANIILSGAGSAIQALGAGNKQVAIDATLTTISAAGSLSILGGRNFTTASTFTNSGTLQVAGGTFTVGGLTNLSGGTLTGGTYNVGAGGTLQLPNNASIVTDNATIILTGAGSAIQSLNTTSSQQVTIEASLTAIAASGVLEILGGRNYTTGNALGNSGLVQLGGGTLTTGGLTEAAGSILSGFGTVGGAFTGGTVTAAGGALAFTGTGDSFAGAIGGTEVDFAGGTDAINSGATIVAANWGISGGATATLNETLNYAGLLTEATGATLALGAYTLTLTGAGSSIAGAVTGTGTLAFAGGSQTINGGASLGMANWSLSGSDFAKMATNLTYAGIFTEAAGATLSTGGGSTLTLGGTGNSLAGAIQGGGAVGIGGATTINGLAIGGTATVTNDSTIDETGTLTLGDTAGDVASFVNAAGATYNFDTDVGIAIGTGAGLTFTNAGTLAKTGGTNYSYVYAAIVNTGTVSVQTGTLSLAGGGSSAAGGLTVAANANLTFTSPTFTITAGGTIGGTGLISLTGGLLAMGANAVATAGGFLETYATLSGTGIFTVNGGLGIMYGDAVQTGAGTTLATGSSTISSGSLDLDGGRVFENQGTLTWSGGGIRLGYTPYTTSAGGGTLKNDAGANFNIQIDGVINANLGANAFVNAGTLTKSVTTGITEVQAVATDTGTIVITTGTIDFDGGGTFAGAISGPGTLILGGGAEAINAGTTIATGALGISGNAAVTLNTNLSYSGTLTQAAGTSLALGGNSLTLSGAGSTLAGGLTGTGTLALASGAAVTLATNLSFGGTFTEAAGASLAIGGGDTLTLTGPVTLAGTVSGAGTLALGSSITAPAGLSLTVANLSLAAGNTITLGAALTYGGAFADAGTVALGAKTLTLTGAGSAIGGAFTGTNTLNFAGGSQALNAGTSIAVSNWNLSGGDSTALNLALTYGGAFSALSGATVTLGSGDALTLGGAAVFSGATVAGSSTLTTGGATAINGAAGGSFTIGGTVTWRNNGAVTAAGGLTLGNNATLKALMINGATGTYNITSNAGIAQGGAKSAFQNAGLFEKTGGTGTSHIGVNFSSTGTVTVGAQTLEFDGPTNSFAGAVGGAGTLGFGGGGGSTLAAGLNLTVAGLSIANAGTKVTLAGSLAYGGIFTQNGGTSVSLGASTLSLGGTSSTLAGAIFGTAGAGSTLALTGGAVAINAGFSLKSDNWSIASGVTVAAHAGFTYAGSFTDGAASLALGGKTVTLAGAASFTGSTIDGAGTLATKGAVSVAGLTLGGAAKWLNSGSVTETGQVTIGDSSGKTGSIASTSSGIWDITGDVGIAPIAGGSGSFANAGLLEKTAGTGISTIGLAVTNSKTIDAASGTLDLSGAVTGTGTMNVTAGATLELDNKVATTQTIAFGTGGGALKLTDASAFFAAVAGFGAGDTLDLTGFAFGGTPKLSFVPNASNTKGVLTIKDGALTAAITLLGQYVNAGFQKAPDSGTGTLITYTPPPGPGLDLAGGHH